MEGQNLNNDPEYDYLVIDARYHEQKEIRENEVAPEMIFENATLFDLYVSSQVCGVRKPNRKGLEYIAGYFGIEVSEILFVGDEKKDEDTAINAGCRFKYIDEYLKL